MDEMPALVPGRVQALVFDLWNTLVYNEHRPNPIIALAEAFGLSRGKPGWTKVVEQGMMRERLSGIREGIESLSRLTGVSLPPGRIESLARLWKEACGLTRLFDDVPPALDRLSSRFRLGLLSNTQSFDLEFLDEWGLGRRFQARVLSCEEGILKPDPALFLQMAERLALAPMQILMVGDNLNDDVIASEAVGMQAVLVRREQVPLSFQEQHPDREPLSTLLDLTEALGL